ncbi:hypothetical protein MMC12_005901 [Toensbergia leucococca]|nr:hypothetical protein [Toensbergia leucococca]
MYSSLHKFILGVAVTLFTFLTDAFNPSANTNLAVYWGQGPNQKRLAHFCEDSDIDIISIAFVNLFPDQDHGGYPGTNFGNQCGSETYNNTDGTPSPLLSNCPTIGPDISYCQAVGKKILLSLGGAYPTNYELNNDESAVEFATFLWGAFGPKKEEWTGPRPFGEASVDGFDLDIESVITPEPADLSYQYRGYATMIDTLRGFYALEDVKEYYISGAPQCIVPDAHLANAIENSWFDFLFVQFYNTPQCSARAFFNHTYGAYGGPSTDISFDSWVHFVQRSSKNSEAKVYLGLPAAPNVTYDAPMYIEPTEAQILIQTFQCKYPNIFGGVMVYEATYSEDYPVDGKSYADEQFVDNQFLELYVLVLSNIVHPFSLVADFVDFEYAVEAFKCLTFAYFDIKLEQSRNSEAEHNRRLEFFI